MSRPSSDRLVLLHLHSHTLRAWYKVLAAPIAAATAGTRLIPPFPSLMRGAVPDIHTYTAMAREQSM